MRGVPDIQTALAVKTFLAKVVETYPIDQAILFGSRARGLHRPDSDADVALVMSGEMEEFLQTKLKMADIAFDAMLETGIIVSPLPIRKEEWEFPERHSNPALLRNIKLEGVVL